MNINLPWKEMDRYIGPLAPGMHVVLHSNIKGNWFFFDALAVPLLDSGEDCTEIVLARYPADVIQCIDSARNLLVEDALYPQGNIRMETGKNTLEEILETVEKSKSRGSAQAIFIDDIGKVVGEDGAPVQWDIAATFLKRMAVEFDIPVIVGISAGCDMTGFRYMEVLANTIFKVGNNRNFDCQRGFIKCHESAGSAQHKKLLVEVIKNQSGALGTFVL